jgi:hypothetical protein
MSVSESGFPASKRMPNGAGMSVSESGIPARTECPRGQA